MMCREPTLLVCKSYESVSGHSTALLTKQVKTCFPIKRHFLFMKAFDEELQKYFHDTT